ncbi:MoaB/Mog domain-containing protein [Paraphysoderma sedebokerense]|nr:MoaB/Mog domain-containing protein [Paraphysoderma sedebokerense]
MNIKFIRIGLLTVSDRVSRGEAIDRSGPALQELIENYLSSHFDIEFSSTKVVPDEIEDIQEVIKEWVDTHSLDVVITTGGTGFGSWDVTPEAIRPLIDKFASGLDITMIATSLKVTPFAMFSRPVCGVRKHSLIITLPGSVNGATENLSAILPGFKHIIELLRGGSGREAHEAVDDSNKEAEINKSKSNLSSQNSCRCSQLDDFQEQTAAVVAGRPRKSLYPMVSVDEAKRLIYRHVSPLNTEETRVGPDLVGRVLSHEVVARESAPSWDASIVDGYAVIASDGPGVYPVTATVTAEKVATRLPNLKTGQICRITTGAPLPPNANAVVMVENTENVRVSDDGEECEVRINQIVVEGENVRNVGCDVHNGEVIMKKGDHISSIGGDIGLLCSVGETSVLTFRRPTVALLSTGNEIVNFDSPDLACGQVRNVNSITLQTALTAIGAKIVDFGVISDDVVSLTSALKKAISVSDVVISTGGVSMGEKDFMKDILVRNLGATIHFGRVKMKPGKPITFATVPANQDPTNHTLTLKEKFLFCLPGNPVSALVTFHVFVVPLLRQLVGMKHYDYPTVTVELSHSIQLDPFRPEYHRAILSYQTSMNNGLSCIKAKSTGQQHSSRMISLKGANGLLILPSGNEIGRRVLEAGEVVNALVISMIE